ncbi:MAG: N-acetylmuramoyl-L-alanine amidase [Bacteroidetes bacterium]|nr:N-acetylmuramoyl-L-alanine amidase [Bacteroidota bacterium]
MQIQTITIKKILGIIALIGLIGTWHPIYAKKKVSKVVIDAGHGGRDPGCHGVYSYEKDITLAVSKKVGKLIQNELKDTKVIYTRDYDWYPELKERTDIANKEKGDLFVSIHVNSTPRRNSPVKGTLVLVCGPSRIEEKEGAIGENANNFEENEGLLDPNDPITQIIIAQYSQAFLSQSIVFGSKINEEFANQGRHTEGIRQQSLQVLASSTMPGVLVEIGYLNNEEEEQYLNSEEGQNKVALAIFKGIKYYKEESEKDPIQIKIEN